MQRVPSPLQTQRIGTKSREWPTETNCLLIDDLPSRQFFTKTPMTYLASTLQRLGVGTSMSCQKGTSMTIQQIRSEVLNTLAFSSSMTSVWLHWERLF